jgi:hypothetical protein
LPNSTRPTPAAAAVGRAARRRRLIECAVLRCRRVTRTTIPPLTRNLALSSLSQSDHVTCLIARSFDKHGGHHEQAAARGDDHQADEPVVTVAIAKPVQPSPRSWSIRLASGGQTRPTVFGPSSNRTERCSRRADRTSGVNPARTDAAEPSKMPCIDCRDGDPIVTAVDPQPFGHRRQHRRVGPTATVESYAVSHYGGSREGTFAPLPPDSGEGDAWPRVPAYAVTIDLRTNTIAPERNARYAIAASTGPTGRTAGLRTGRRVYSSDEFAGRQSGITHRQQMGKSD